MPQGTMFLPQETLSITTGLSGGRDTVQMVPLSALQHQANPTSIACLHMAPS